MMKRNRWMNLTNNQTTAFTIRTTFFIFLDRHYIAYIYYFYCIICKHNTHIFTNLRLLCKKDRNLCAYYNQSIAIDWNDGYALFVSAQYNCFRYSFTRVSHIYCMCCPATCYCVHLSIYFILFLATHYMQNIHSTSHFLVFSWRCHIQLKFLVICFLFVFSSAQQREDH